MKSLCSLNMNSTKLSADTYEDLKVTPPFSPPPANKQKWCFAPMQLILQQKGCYNSR